MKLTTRAARALSDMGPAFVGGMSFTQLDEHLAAIESEAAAHWKGNHDTQVRIKDNLHRRYSVLLRHEPSVMGCVCGWQVGRKTTWREHLEAALAVAR